MKLSIVYLTLWAALIVTGGIAHPHNDNPSDIAARRIEVGFTKTVHIIFPASVTYIDIGSMDIIAGKADGAGNVVRVKAAVKEFSAETNLTIITEDGGFYTFDARYAENPAVSTIEVAPASTATSAVAPQSPGEGRVLLEQVGKERPATIKKLLAEIYRQNRSDVRNIHTKRYGIEVEIRGIYVHNDVIYIHTQIANSTNISFEVDACRFIIADKKAAKRTAQQQTIHTPLRICNEIAVVRGRQRQRTVFALPKLTIPDDKVLLLEIIERHGARHQVVEIGNKELLSARTL